MPRLVIAGNPGSVYVNDTGKIVYQWHCNFSNSCGNCIGNANQIGSWWPLPFHRGCTCDNIPILPGKPAAAFIDYQSEVAKLDPAQQSRVMGAANWKLVSEGRVKWSDVVTPNRIRTLQEVVAREKLTVRDLERAGISTGTAERAFHAVHTAAHIATAAERKAIISTLAARGVSAEAIRTQVGRRIVERVGIGPSPRGERPGPAAPPAVAPLAIPPLGGRPAPVESGPAKPDVAAKEGQPESETFGRSSAKVKHIDYEESDILKPARSILGREVTMADIASLAGAPDDSVVNISVVDDLTLSIFVSGPGGSYRMDRTLKRASGRAVLVNEYFAVDPGHQGKGIGRTAFGRQVEQAAKFGVDRIDTIAARDEAQGEFGYKVWPKFGYDGLIPAHVADAARSGAIAAIPGGLDPDRAKLSDLMATQAGRAWWAEYGDSAHMTFDLHADSLSRMIWADYLRAKTGDASKGKPAN